MGDHSRIEWTSATWNPTVGCTKISPGCKFCYAEVMHRRLTAMGVKKYRQSFRVVQPWEDALDVPLRWREPRLIFVNSMSDLFHDEVPDEYIHRVFDVMRRAHWHTFQVLTKRSERLRTLGPHLPWPDNVWMGVSVETAEYLHRIADLRAIKPAVRFLSLEPLLGPLGRLALRGIGWVIVGGESGHHARPMDLDWARDIRNQCVAAGVPFFLKQLGGQRDKRGGDAARLDRRLWRELPLRESSEGVVRLSA